MTDNDTSNDESNETNAPNGRPRPTAAEKRPESSNTARSSMRDVSHTPPNQSESANRVFERGGEFDDEEDEEDAEEEKAADGGRPRTDGRRVNATRVFERGGEFGRGYRPGTESGDDDVAS